jgi:hypothetical protein
MSAADDMTDSSQQRLMQMQRLLQMLGLAKLVLLASGCSQWRLVAALRLLHVEREVACSVSGWWVTSLRVQGRQTKRRRSIQRSYQLHFSSDRFAQGYVWRRVVGRAYAACRA